MKDQIALEAQICREGVPLTGRGKKQYLIITKKHPLCTAKPNIHCTFKKQKGNITICGYHKKEVLENSSTKYRSLDGIL